MDKTRDAYLERLLGKEKLQELNISLFDEACDIVAHIDSILETKKNGRLVSKHRAIKAIYQGMRNTFYDNIFERMTEIVTDQRLTIDEARSRICFIEHSPQEFADYCKKRAEEIHSQISQKPLDEVASSVWAYSQKK